MDELLEQFRIEAPELVQQASDDLLTLERTPHDRARLDSAFRAVHTLKGSVALFDMAPLGEALHAAEDVLGAVRAAAAVLPRAQLDATLELLAASDAWFAALDETGALPADAAETCARLRDRLRAPTPAAAPEAADPAVEARADGPDRGGRALRVDPARIDDLLGSVGELAAINAALAQLPTDRAAGAALSVQQRRLERVSADLHDAAMRLRLAPLSRTFERLPRLVRELAGRLGKAVRLELEGGELEADRTVVDALFEPLMHLVRNALDHGVEPPEVRHASGKPDVATLHIAARHEADALRIELSDDGRGVAFDAVRRRALSRGLIDAHTADGLDEAATLELLFVPGFSTAEEVSDISGRGVGLDSVRAAMEAVGGRIALTSTPGVGTTFSLSAPLSATLTHMLLLRVGEQTYGAPLADLAQTLRLPRERLMAVGEGEAIVWRGRTTPVLWLHDRVGAPRPEPRGDLRLVIASPLAGGAAFVVDGFAGRASAVVRPLPRLLADLQGMGGVALSAQEEVVFVLDLEAMSH